MSDSDSTVKVIDKRIFTPDGELREGYRHLDKEVADSGAEEVGESREETSGEVDEVSSEPAPEPQPEPTPEPQPEAARPDPVLDTGATGPGPKPSFFDLIGVLAEPIPLFLGDAKLPDGKSAENLDLARFHIDLLEVIQARTAGNLSAEESALMEDLLYRLRLRYVEKTSP